MFHILFVYLLLYTLHAEAISNFKSLKQEFRRCKAAL